MSAKFKKLSTAEAVEQYVSSRLPASPISINDAVRTIRMAVPQCEMTDIELGAIVARCAIASGRCVDFDQADSDSTEDAAAGFRALHPNVSRRCH